MSATPSQGSCSGTQVITCDLGSIASTGAATVAIVIRPAAVGTIANIATVAGDQPDPDPTTNAVLESTTVLPTPPSADLSVTKTDSPDPVVVGENLTYTVTARNNGPDAATGVVLDDALPVGVVFTAVSTTQGTCVEDSGFITCTLGGLATGAEAIRIQRTTRPPKKRRSSARVPSICR